MLFISLFCCIHFFLLADDEPVVPMAYTACDMTIYGRCNLAYDECSVAPVGVCYFDAMYGHGRGYQKGYYGMDLMLFTHTGTPKEWKSCFLDCSIERINHYYHDIAYNIGCGGRISLREGEEVLGWNLYHDYRTYTVGNRTGHFYQVGSGIELLGKSWEVRSNGYIPLGYNLFLNNIDTYYYNMPYVAYRHKCKTAMWGVDIEVGKRLKEHACFDLYAALGAYSYSSSYFYGTLFGGKARGQIALYPNVVLACEGTYDKEFGTSIQMKIVIALPGSSSITSRVWSQEPVVRNKIIVLDNVYIWY